MQGAEVFDKCGDSCKACLRSGLYQRQQCIVVVHTCSLLNHNFLVLELEDSNYKVEKLWIMAAKLGSPAGIHIGVMEDGRQRGCS
ncbi:hypothetical protein GOP47_0008235 [Adiantum capillus-veneris]|uniref:Uncharacterized protein n=1 Tax=Adiantum capillus-veneris TaxID=13818 RepID=A0A9D4UXW2_ADICA|nr:hypothetical protein GOP47_0008235 [Adiantum capillus-veneris]